MGGVLRAPSALTWGAPPSGALRTRLVLTRGGPLRRTLRAPFVLKWGGTAKGVLPAPFLVSWGVAPAILPWGELPSERASLVPAGTCPPVPPFLTASRRLHRRLHRRRLRSVSLVSAGTCPPMPPFLTAPRRLHCRFHRRRLRSVRTRPPASGSTSASSQPPETGGAALGGSSAAWSSARRRRPPLRAPTPRPLLRVRARRRQEASLVRRRWLAHPPQSLPWGGTPRRPRARRWRRRLAPCPALIPSLGRP